MACISVTSLHLAVQQLGLPQIDPDDLVVISQVNYLPALSLFISINNKSFLYSVVAHQEIWNVWPVLLQINLVYR